MKRAGDGRSGPGSSRNASSFSTRPQSQPSSLSPLQHREDALLEARIPTYLETLEMLSLEAETKPGKT